ncbi:MAG: hypothetical protein ACPGUY_01985 [Akkermansiaceae bacterium]
MRNAKRMRGALRTCAIRRKRALRATQAGGIARNTVCVNAPELVTVSESEKTKKHLAEATPVRLDPVESKPKLAVGDGRKEATGLELSPTPRVVRRKVQLEEVEGKEVKSVHRLQQSEKQAKRHQLEKVAMVQREKAEAPDEKQELEWEESASSFGWVLYAGVAAILLVVAAIALKLSFSDDEQVEASVTKPAIEEDPFAGTPEQWFRKRSVALQGQAIELLRKFNAAESAEERSLMVRKPQEYLQKTIKESGPLDVNLGKQVDKKWDVSHTEDTAFLTLDTLNQDFMPARVYFTQDQGELKIDWQASQGWSVMSIGQMKAAFKKQNSTNTAAVDFSKPQLVRCRIKRREEFYAGKYNDQDHSAYLLMSENLTEYLWGYVPKNSTLDLELKKLLDHGSFVVSLKKNLRVTLTLKRSEKDALPSQVEVVELLHPDWVTP